MRIAAGAALLAADTPWDARDGVGDVGGGKPAESSPCDPLSPHGFYGKEAQTADAISAWMLGRPFARNIE